MIETPIKKEIVDGLVQELGINDFAKATIREVKQVAAKAEKASGVEFIKMEMGIPGLPAAQVGVDAQIKALEQGIAHSYPDIQGAPVLKQEASRFVKAFIGLDVASECCVPVTGSMQGTFASFLTCSQADKRKDTVLFIDPGFPVQKMQLQVQGVKYETFDVYDYRGEKLAPKLESYLCKGNICAIVYSNPNNYGLPQRPECSFPASLSTVGGPLYGELYAFDIWFKGIQLCWRAHWCGLHLKQAVPSSLYRPCRALRRFALWTGILDAHALCPVVRNQSFCPVCTCSHDEGSQRRYL